MRAVAAACAVALLAPMSGARAATERQVISRHWTARDQQVGRYQYVPFAVPPGTTELTVEYRYDRHEGANVIDLGLFEPGPLTLGTPAFRGWSGGARSRVTVAADGATPGYWPGPLPAGQWHVALGLYKVGPSGVEVEITVETSARPAGPVPRPQLAAGEPLRRGEAWYVGALHTHTVHSDGALTTAELIRKAAAEKLDFAAITDHNNTTHQLDTVASAGVLVISGEEVTTPGGHFGVLGLEGDRAYIDFRILPGRREIADVIHAARARGAVVAINHPVDDCLACSWTHAVPDAVNAIEIANGDASARQQAILLWDALLRSGRRVTAIGESDWHRGDAPIGRPALRVRAAELSTRAILAGVAAGRAVVMASSALPPPVLTVGAGEWRASVGAEARVAPGELVAVHVELPAPVYVGGRVELVWNGETVATAVVPDSQTVRFDRYPMAPGYLRVHVIGSGGEPLAITNPVFVAIGQ